MKKHKIIKYVVTDIIYDTDDTTNLPKELTIKVLKDIGDDCDKLEIISEEISNITGFLHKGFVVNPKINCK